jgi:spore coat protein U-like protein
MCANEHAVGGAPEAVTGHAPAPRRLRVARALSLLLSGAILAWAAPAAAACRFTGVTNMSFSGYSPVGGAVAATATLSYRCTGITWSATIAITPTTRTMTGPGGTLAFELYEDSGRTTVFPGSPAWSIPIVANGTVTVYGYLTPQDVAAGTYTRTFTATLVSNGFTTRTTTFTASTTVLGVCTIAAPTLAFGPYTPVATTDGAATLSVACTRGTAYTVGLNAGSHPSGSTRQMQMGATGDLLQYELYSNAGRTVVWSSTAVVGGTAATSAAIALPVYGRIPAGQFVEAGDYRDDVTSTVNF